MPKFLSYALLITIGVVVTILMLPHILAQRVLPTYTDNQLREAALSKGMLSVPKDYSALLKIKDNKKILTKRKIILGKELYFDTNLSKHLDTSCATCHLISKDLKSKKIPVLNQLTGKKMKMTNCAICHLRDESGVDRLSSAIGDNGAQNPQHLNTMTILNSSLAKYLTWSAKKNSIEDEVGLSITSPFKMNMEADLLIKKLQNTPKYLKEFNKVFQNSSHNNSINFKHIEEAIGAYVRTLLTRGTYDEFLDGDDKAISAKAKRGLANFMNFGCKGCHTGMSVGGQVIERFPLKDFASVEILGFNTPFISSTNIFPFQNIGGFLGKDNKHLFRVPILRNVTKTSPYFHNGAIAKIEEAVAIMGKHQLGIKLSDTQIDEIVAFLKTLDGKVVDYNLDLKKTR